MAKRYKSGFYEIAKKAAISPKESMVDVHRNKNVLKIGVPREVSFQENRVGLTPQGVRLLTSLGYEVIIEHNAGLEANFQNRDYSEVGAKISYDKKEVFKSDIIMKVAFPLIEEIEMMPGKQTILSALHLPLMQKKQIQMLMKKQTSALCFENIKDEANTFPVIQAMSEIAGNASILIGAEYLSNANHGKGIMLGGLSGVPPCEVVIIGAGTVGQFATRAALGLGANVKMFDSSLYRLRRLLNYLSNPVYTAIIHPELLLTALRTADLVIGAVRATDGRQACIVNEEMVMNMKPGSVVVDVSIDQGGCFETSEVTTHAEPTFVKHDVIHYCVPNIPSRVSRTASYALTNIFVPMLVEIGECGGIKNYLWEKEFVRHGVFLYKGNLTNKIIAEKFEMPYKEIDLLIAANI